MLKKILSVALVGLLINLASLNAVYADSKDEKEARFAEKVRKSIVKLGVGTGARVEIKLRDKTKLTGYLKEVGEDSFVIVDSKSGVATTVTYPQVKQVKGNNFSTGAKIAIGVAVGIAIVLLVALGKRCSNEGGC